MKKKLKIERVDLFGDTTKIVYDTERRQFQGVGRLGFYDIARLLDKIAEHYEDSKTKRGRRIAEISAELSHLIRDDGCFMAETYSFIANGETVLLEPEKIVIAPKAEY